MDEEVIEPELGNSDNSDVPENQTSETESQANWTDSFSEVDKKMISDKGWKSPQDMFKSYQEVEKFASNKISIPKADDAEAWKKLDAKLGCPETIEGYELTDVAEVDKPYLDDFKKTALETGMRPNQVKAMYDFYKSRQDQITEAFNAQVEKDKEEIRSEWGDDYSKNEELMKRGVTVLGLSEDLLTNIEVSIGTKAFMELGKRLGEAISEDTAKGLGGGATISEEITTQKFFDEIMSQGANFL
jgi:hypothetical protein